MRLWDWAIHAYDAPGVDEALVALQDVHGQCVSYLLWAAWTARARRSLTDENLARAAEVALRWEGQVTAPLRAARRALKPAWPLISDEDREALRERVKQNELGAEQRLMDALESLAPGGGERATVIERLRAASAIWPTSAPYDELERLGQMFERADI